MLLICIINVTAKCLELEKSIQYLTPKSNVIFFLRNPPKHTHQSKDQPLQYNDLGGYTCFKDTSIWQKMSGTPLWDLPLNTQTHSFEYPYWWHKFVLWGYIQLEEMTKSHLKPNNFRITWNNFQFLFMCLFVCFFIYQTLTEFPGSFFARHSEGKHPQFTNLIFLNLWGHLEVSWSRFSYKME